MLVLNNRKSFANAPVASLIWMRHVGLFQQGGKKTTEQSLRFLRLLKNIPKYWFTQFSQIKVSTNYARDSFSQPFAANEKIPLAFNLSCPLL